MLLKNNNRSSHKIRFVIYALFIEILFGSCFRNIVEGNNQLSKYTCKNALKIINNMHFLHLKFVISINKIDFNELTRNMLY